MTSKSKKTDPKIAPDAEPLKVNKWDSSAVKHAIDDSVKTALLDRPNCTEYFALMDGRLLICGLAVGIALLALGWDHQYPFPQSKPVLIICVCSYFVLMGILTLYTTLVEKGIFVIATQTDGTSSKTWQASSDMKKYDDKYTLVLSVKDGKSIRETSVTKSSANFIDTNGVILDNLVANELNRIFNSLNADKKEK